MTNRLARLRHMPRDEMAWRGTTALRAAAQRLDVRVRPPRWERHDIQSVLAEGVVSPAVHAAITRNDWQTVHDALARVLLARRSRFILDPESAGALRTEVSARWPSAAPDAASRADRILAGQYDVLGYRGLAFVPGGHEVDWHLDPAHNRRAPRQFWADVPYLDPAIGDHKVIWELNRHQHWLQLGRALWLTRDPRYGREIVNQLQSWLVANPPLMGINWASMLEIGFRAISWTWALHFLIAGAEAPALQVTGNVRSAAVSTAATPWLVDLLVGLDRQMTHVEQNLSRYFSPNTHLTGEALALYVVGHALPELEASDRWVKTGRRILLDEIDRQIHADGGHAERSTHYQRYTLDFYLHALLTAERVQDREAIPALRNAVTRLAEFTRTMADDRGRLPLIGDDDGGMLWPIAGRPCDDVRDSLALAAIVLERPELAPWGVPEEVFWIAGRDAIARAAVVEARLDQRLDQRLDNSATLPSRALPDTGYVVLRDSRGGHAVLDAGDHGYLNGGHAHADALAVTLTLANRPLLVDPGTSTYTMDPRLRDRMRSSTSHNTVTIDGRPQSIPAGPFHWRTRANARLHASRHNPVFDWAEASHDGYGDVRHRRTLFRTAAGGWLLVDDFAGDGRHAAAAHWHFDPAWEVTADAPGRLRASHADGETAWLLHDGGDIRLGRGEASGMGWHAPTYGTLIPTWCARVTREETAPFAMMTWIGASDTMPGARPVLERLAATTSGPGEHVLAARVIAGCRTSVFLLRPDAQASPNADCGVGDYQTNARALHYTEDAGRLTSLDLVDASHAFTARDGWISIAASAPMADLHLALEGDLLDICASAPGPQLRVEGGFLPSVRAIRVNGRELPPTARLSNSLVIDAADWVAPALARLALRT